MPIKSTKPSRGPQNRIGTAPKPTLADYASEAQITATGQARRQINRFNGKILRMTQPYAGAATLRAGNLFRQRQEAAIRAENVGAAPYRGLGSTRLGKRRPLPDVGP